MMTVVKRMTAKKDFLKMPLKERKCKVELYEDCRTRKLLEECNCVPWEVPGYQVRTHKNKRNSDDCIAYHPIVHLTIVKY